MPGKEEQHPTAPLEAQDAKQQEGYQELHPAGRRPSERSVWWCRFEATPAGPPRRGGRGLPDAQPGLMLRRCSTWCAGCCLSSWQARSAAALQSIPAETAGYAFSSQRSGEAEYPELCGLLQGDR